MLRLAIDRGVDYVDTAFPYHGGGDRSKQGESEPFVGQALRGGYREKVKLATKLPTWLVKSHADMHKFLDAQLKALETSHIDYYLAHNLTEEVWEPMKRHKLFDFFEEAMKDGRIRYPSFSFHDQFPLFKTIVESYDWSMTQVQYNYLDVNFQAGTEGVRLAASRGIAVVVMEPLRGGYLVKYMPESEEKALREVRPDWSLAAWCLHWLWNQPEVCVVLSGMSNMEQTLDNLKSAENHREGLFGARDQECVERIQKLFGSRVKVSCTNCGYCMPCPTGVHIPKNLDFLNQYHLFEAAEVKKRCFDLYGMLLSVQEKALSCVECGECVEKCPQHLAIPELLGETCKTFSAPPTVANPA
jgi:predicted aldo/keto reductase-like oxidoreductase